LARPRPSSAAARAGRRAAALLCLVPAAALAQNDSGSVLRHFDLDKLQITTLGVAYGYISPSQLVPTNLYAIQADYGNLSPKWRAVFGASYWATRFEDEVIQAFADSLHKSLSDSSARVNPSTVRLYDVTFNADLRYTPNPSGTIKPFVGAGIAAHVINAEGALIKGTFVERSLDDIAAGVYVVGGASIKLASHLGIEGTARADLLSGFRSLQVRAGASYYFGHVRGPRPVTAPSGAKDGR
jgi:hypothetical protein